MEKRTGSKRLMIAMATLGFASGAPAAVLRDPFKAWLTDRHFSLTDVGRLSVLTLPASLKFLWAPFMDRYAPPWLGRRRGWLLVTQLLLAAVFFSLGGLGKFASFRLILAVGLMAAVFSASQDVVVDAYRTETLPADRRGVGTSLFVNFYRLAYIATAAGTLYLVGKWHVSWSTAIAAVGAVLLLMVFATIMAPSESVEVKPPRTLEAAVVGPIVSLWRQPNALAVLLFVFTFKIPEMMINAAGLPFLMNIGLSKETIAGVKLTMGTSAGIAGAFVAAFIVHQWGLRRTLWTVAVAGAVSNMGYWCMARVGPVHSLLVTAVCTESFCAGMVGAVLVVFLTSRCEPTFAATQYAVLSGLAGLSEGTLGSGAGWFAAKAGWPTYFLVSVAAVAPAIILLRWITVDSSATEGFAVVQGE